MADPSALAQKIGEVKEEMKRTGLWSGSIPEWVIKYGNREPGNKEDFSEWMQFVYLPNRNEQEEKNYIAPQAIKFFGADIQKGKLLQLLIELDSL